MVRQKGFIAMVLFFVLAVFFTNARAAEEKIMLKGEYMKKAKGEAVIKDAMPGQKEITLEATGLKPNSVYTLWVVNMKPKMDMAGVGTGDYSFKSDDKGNVKYTAAISEEELKKWQMLEVAYHPTGDPKDMKKMKVALKGELKK